MEHTHFAIIIILLALIVASRIRGFIQNHYSTTPASKTRLISFAANALSLGSCWINQLRWLNEDPGLVEYLQSLGMEENERVYGAVIIGYPAGELNRNLMKQKGNIITFINE